MQCVSVTTTFVFNWTCVALGIVGSTVELSIAYVCWLIGFAILQRSIGNFHCDAMDGATGFNDLGRVDRHMCPVGHHLFPNGCNLRFVCRGVSVCWIQIQSIDKQTVDIGSPGFVVAAACGAGRHGHAGDLQLGLIVQAGRFKETFILVKDIRIVCIL